MTSLSTCTWIQANVGRLSGQGTCTNIEQINVTSASGRFQHFPLWQAPNPGFRAIGRLAKHQVRMEDQRQAQSTDTQVEMLKRIRILSFDHPWQGEDHQQHHYIFRICSTTRHWKNAIGGDWLMAHTKLSQFQLEKTYQSHNNFAKPAVYRIAS